jgi:HK97 family phage major capsid protein
MPRVVPKHARSAEAEAALIHIFPPLLPDPQEAHRLDRLVEADAEAQRGKEPPPHAPYSPTSRYSFFRDLLIVAEHDARRAQARANPVLRGHVDEPIPAPGERSAGGVEGARSRLRRAARQMGPLERRDLSTAAGTGGEFVPPGAPAFIGVEFAAAARAQATLAAALPRRPLPDAGLKIEVPRIATGATVAVQASENAAVSETDPTTAMASSNLATIAGDVDMSRQLFERARPGMDEVLARDLGRALGAALDAQLVAGTNATGQTRGIANVTGIIAVTYTDASPTVAEIVSKIFDAYQQLAGSSGYGIASPDEYVVVLHPRRLALLSTSADALRSLESFAALIPTAGVRTTLGAGTNEDEIFVVARGEVFVAQGEPVIDIFPEVGSTTATVRVQARQYAGAMFGRAPNAVARISGTGLSPPLL